MKEAIKSLIPLFMIIISVAVLTTFIEHYGKTTKVKIEVCDTIYNKVIFDSIEYNIVKRDTIIYNIKTEMKDEIKKSKLVTDSDAVKLFNKLVAE